MQRSPPSPSPARRLSLRPALFLASLAVACGSASPPAAEPEAAAPAPTTEPAVQPVLVLGVGLRAARFELLADGTVRDGVSVWGRLEVDGTLRRADGSVCARVARSGAIVFEPRAGAARSDLSLYIEGRDLVMVEDGEPHVVMSVDGGDLVHDGRRDTVPGLTPERHRAMLAAHALFFMVLFFDGVRTM